MDQVADHTVSESTELLELQVRKVLLPESESVLRRDRVLGLSGLDERLVVPIDNESIRKVLHLDSLRLSGWRQKVIVTFRILLGMEFQQVLEVPEKLLPFRTFLEESWFLAR